MSGRATETDRISTDKGPTDGGYSPAVESRAASGATSENAGDPEHGRSGLLGSSAETIPSLARAEKAEIRRARLEHVRTLRRRGQPKSFGGRACGFQFSDISTRIDFDENARDALLVGLDRLRLEGEHERANAAGCVEQLRSALKLSWEQLIRTPGDLEDDNGAEEDNHRDGPGDEGEAHDDDWA